MFVDDDPNVGQAMRRMLRPMRKEWDMAFANSGQEALDTMERDGAFDIIVSDMQMPGMHGSELLANVMKLYPQTVRFALSGEAGGDSMIRTAAIVHQFMTKPCDPGSLIEAINGAFALREQLHNKRLQQLLFDMGGVPSVPKLYQEVLQEMQSPDPSLSAIGKLIEKDAGMSAKVLQIVNSASLGISQRITNVVQAATLLGISNIRNLVLMAEAFYPAQEQNLPANFSLDALWNQSLRVASAARRIAEVEADDKKIADDAFTAGLLHDIGQIILATRKTEEFGEVLERAYNTGKPLTDIERDEFGATHGEIGGYLLELWGLPDAIVEAITFHDVPSGTRGEEFTALSALHVACYFCKGMNEKNDGTSTSFDFDSLYVERIGFSDRTEIWYELCQQDDELTI